MTNLHLKTMCFIGHEPHGKDALKFRITGLRDLRNLFYFKIRTRTSSKAITLTFG